MCKVNITNTAHRQHRNVLPCTCMLFVSICIHGPLHLLRPVRRDPKVFPGQPVDIVSPTCPGSSPGPPPCGRSPEHLSWEAFRRRAKNRRKAISAACIHNLIRSHCPKLMTIGEGGNEHRFGKSRDPPFGLAPSSPRQASTVTTTLQMPH